MIDRLFQYALIFLGGELVLNSGYYFGRCYFMREVSIKNLLSVFRRCMMVAYAAYNQCEGPSCGEFEGVGEGGF